MYGPKELGNNWSEIVGSHSAPTVFSFCLVHECTCYMRADLFTGRMIHGPAISTFILFIALLHFISFSKFFSAPFAFVPS